MAGVLVRKAGTQSVSGRARAWAAALQQEGQFFGYQGDLGFGDGAVLVVVDGVGESPACEAGHGREIVREVRRNGGQRMSSKG